MKVACLLRAVNVSGKRKIVMKELCAKLLDLSHDRVDYYLQSGNLIFDTSSSVARIKEDVSSVLLSEYGYNDVSLICLSHGQLVQILELVPTFASDQDPKTIHFTLTEDDVGVDRPEGMLPDNVAPDSFQFRAPAFYDYCPNGYGRTKLNNQFFEAKFKICSTTRNFNTMNKLLDMTAA